MKVTEIVTPEDRQALFYAAQWSHKRKYFRVEKIRQLAGSEEIYRILIREIDRVRAQVGRAHAFGVEATLTLLDWLTILEQFNWLCAYCQCKPFEIMSHIIPLPRGGTTPENCVPSCYSCGTGRRKKTYKRKAL